MRLRRHGFGLLSLLAVGVVLSAIAAQSDDLIVPGVRVGPVGRDSTIESLLQSLGKLAVRTDIDTGEGSGPAGLVIFPDDPTRRLGVTFDDASPSHPDVVFICYQAVDKLCKWHTRRGVRYGLTLKEVERLNGGRFELTGTGTDVSGNVVQYDGGRLANELMAMGRLMLTFDVNGPRSPGLTEADYDAITGDRIFSSDHPSFQKMNPKVIGMTMWFPRR